MQTFLPYPTYSQSAHVLDRQRLGKQRSESLQILRTLVGLTSGWSNHPAVRMWRGYESALATYTWIVCAEWRNRGYKDTVKDKVLDLTEEFNIRSGPLYPPWLTDSPLCSTHRAALLYKLPEHYSKFGWTEPPALNYYWPTKEASDAHNDN